MAKKKEEGLKYLQVPLPAGQKRGKMTKLSWSGINYRNTKDSGEISAELNISTISAPHLTPSEKRQTTVDLLSEYGNMSANIKFNNDCRYYDMYAYDNTLVCCAIRDLKNGTFSLLCHRFRKQNNQNREKNNFRRSNRRTGKQNPNVYKFSELREYRNNKQ